MGITPDSGGVRSVERALAIVELLGEHQALGLARGVDANAPLFGRRPTALKHLGQRWRRDWCR